MIDPYFLASIIVNIFLIALFAIIIANGKSSDCRDYIVHKSILFSDLEPYIDVGDLILFSSSRCHTITRNLGNPFYSHVGIITKHNNNINERGSNYYVMEYVMNNFVYPYELRHKGPKLTKLSDRIKDYSGTIYYAKSLKMLTDAQKEIINNYYANNSKKYFYAFCSEYIGNVLREAGIANPSRFALWKVHNEIIALCNNKDYSFPVKILNNASLINEFAINNDVDYCINN